MLSARAVRLWYRIHKWTSLICTAFLLLLCITGLPLIFHDEIDDFFENAPAVAPSRPGVPKISLDRIVDAAQRAYEREVVHLLHWKSEEPDIVKLRMGASPDTDSDDLRTLVFDARTGDLLERDQQE